jgi:hypothetical protein
MEVLKGQVKLGADGMAVLGARAKELNEAMLSLVGAQLVQQQLPLWDQYKEKILAVQAALEKKRITEEQAAAASKKAALDVVIAYGQEIAQISQDLASGFAGFAAKNKEFAGAAKNLAIANATISGLVGAAKAWEWGPILGPIGAAAALVATAGMVAKISAQQFAKGGSFKVPGGISGIDSMVVPLALSAGERVDVTPSSQMRDRGGQPQEIRIGVGMGDFITGRNLRDLVEALNQGARDGYRLRVAD